MRPVTRRFRREKNCRRLKKFSYGREGRRPIHSVFSGTGGGAAPPVCYNHVSAEAPGRGNAGVNNSMRHGAERRATRLEGYGVKASPVFLSRERIVAYATILAVTELTLFVFCAAGAHGLIVPMDKMPSTDFVSFHAAGALANAGTPWLAYDQAAHRAAETASLGRDAGYNYFFYPPVFLLICAPLARLPYLLSFLTFQAIGAAACYAALRLIRRDLPVVVVFAFPGVWWAIGTGQNALLTAALFAAGTALLDRRPWLAGVFLGALCYKPHFGLLIPVALLAGGHWRAIVSAAAAVAGLAGASVVLFGAETWRAFLTAAAGSGDVYAGHAIFMGGLTSPYGVAMVFGLGRAASFGIQAAAAGLAALAVFVVWRRGGPLPVRAAVLLAATPVAVPVLMFYDLMLVFVALVWVSRLGPAGQLPGWAQAGLAAAFLAPLLSGNIGSEMPVPFAAVAAMAAFGVVLGLAAREMAWRPVSGPVGAAGGVRV